MREHASDEETLIRIYYRQVVFQWTTRDQGTPTARLGTTSGNYTISQTGNSTTYYPSDLCTSPANDTGYIFPGFFNAVLISNLLPSTKYYYTVGDPVSKARGRSFQAVLTPSSVLHSILGEDRSPNCVRSMFTWASEKAIQVAQNTSTLMVTLDAEHYVLLQNVLYSPEYHFTTAPTVGPSSNVNMIVWADSGQAIADGSYEWEW